MDPSTWLGEWKAGRRAACTVAIMSRRRSQLLLTGPPKVGKSTVVGRVVDLLKARGVGVGGFVTDEVRRDGVRIGFVVRSIADGRAAVLAHVDLESGVRVGKFGVDVGAFEGLGLPALNDAIARRDVVVVDEIARMELASAPFREVVGELAGVDVPVLATVHVYEDPVTDALKASPETDLIEVTHANRDSLPELLADRLVRLRAAAG